MQAMIMTLCAGNVPSQQAVKLVFVGRIVVLLKMGWIGGNGFAIGDVNTKIVP